MPFLTNIGCLRPMSGGRLFGAYRRVVFMAEDQKGSFSVPAHIAIIMDGNGRLGQTAGFAA